MSLADVIKPDHKRPRRKGGQPKSVWKKPLAECSIADALDILRTPPPPRKRDFLDDMIETDFPKILAEQEAEAKLEQAALQARAGWPAYGTTTHPITGYVAHDVPLYVSRRTGNHWAPRSQEERDAILSDSPRYLLLRGGEGSGKSAGAVIKTLERLRRAMDWIFASPDFEHFKTSAWPLFREWCPLGVVDRTDAFMLAETWEAARKFELHLRSEREQKVSTLRCMGIDDPHAVRGGNVHGATFDEASRHKEPTAFKFLAGRTRLLGPNGEPPQLVLATTPEMHWLYDYFGPIQETDEGEPDPWLEFKQHSLDVVLDTKENLTNLDPEYVRGRSALLTESEKRVYMGGQWEAINDSERFLESMIWWTACGKDYLPPLHPDEPLIVAADAAYAAGGDTFGLVGVSRHPYRENQLAVRLIRIWTPTNQQALDFDTIEADIEQLKSQYNILSIHYDPKELHQMMTGLRKRRVVHTVEFQQGVERAIADKGLKDLIQQRRISWHASVDGSGALYKHIDNANRKLESNSGLRIVKRTESKKIDLCVALSMAVHRGAKLWRKRQKPQGTSIAAGMR